MEVAHRYLPVGASVVGGDWHDIVPLPGGRAALIVGDAMGHGPEAAAVMVQLRTAAHTLADLELAPGQVLRRLDRMAAGMAAAPFATVHLHGHRPSRQFLRGRPGRSPAAVLVLPGGATRVLDLPPGLPLGLGAESFEATQISLPAGCHPRPVHRRAGGKPHPVARRRTGRAAATLSAPPWPGPAARWAAPARRYPDAARAWRGRHHPRPRPHPPMRIACG